MLLGVNTEAWAGDSCEQTCHAARSACRNQADKQGQADIATLRRRADPPLSAPEIANFMRRERDLKSICERRRIGCMQSCAGEPESRAHS
jgi:hypothetical protein